MNQPITCMATLGVDGLYADNLTYTTRGGILWFAGFPSTNMINTILPPNGPTCARTTDGAEQMLVPPTSYHPGGVQVVFCDGSVSFVTDTINTGNLTVGSQEVGRSPYGVWGALGSKDGAESMQKP